MIIFVQNCFVQVLQKEPAAQHVDSIDELCCDADIKYK